jgi:heat shock protein HslJ
MSAVKVGISLQLAFALCTGPLLAGCQAAGSAPGESDLQGFWQVDRIGDQPAVQESRANLIFSKSEITGNAGCNRFFGKYRYHGGELTVDPDLGGTKMMCRPSVMAQENDFLLLLPQVRRVELHGGVLVLLNDGGEVLISARRVEDNK